MAEAKENRKEKFPVGIVGFSLEQADREIPPGDPPAWPENDKLAVIGKPTPRVDGRAKVTGAAKFSASFGSVFISSKA